MSRRKQPVYPPPPAWLVIGARVDYRNMVGGPVTLANTTVRSEPWQLGHGEWVVMIKGVTGGVAIDALTQPPIATVRIQPASLEIEMTMSIEGENLTGESLGALTKSIAGMIGGRDV